MLPYTKIVTLAGAFVWFGTGCVHAPEPSQPLESRTIETRRELFEVSDATEAHLRKAAAATALLTHQSMVEEVSRGVYRLKALTLRENVGDRTPWCSAANFTEQKTAGHCSGILVSRAALLTAASCIARVPCADTFVVFGYAMDSRSSDLRTPAREQVRRCVRLLHPGTSLGRIGGTAAPEDYVILQLDDAPGGDVRPATITRDMPRKLTLMAHPLGLPLKITDELTAISQPKVRGTVAAGQHDTTRAKIAVAPSAVSAGAPMFDTATGSLAGIVTSTIGLDSAVEGDAMTAIYRSQDNGEICRGWAQCRQDVDSGSVTCPSIPVLGLAETALH